MICEEQKKRNVLDLVSCMAKSQGMGAVLVHKYIMQSKWATSWENLLFAHTKTDLQHGNLAAYKHRCFSYIDSSIP